MWPFSKKYTLLESGVFQGWTDRHSHILYGVDDGIRTLEDSLAVLKYYEEIGVNTVWCTPHIMEDMPNEPEELKERFAKLCEAYKGNITLHLAAENMLDSLFVERLEKGELMPYGDNGDELLVETSYVQPPYRFTHLLQDIRKAGYHPVLAHPERYRYMDFDYYERLHSQGIRFQMNITSLAGAYGEKVKENAEELLEAGFYTYQGSDVHRLSSLQHAFNEKVLKKEIKERIAK